MNFDGKSIAAAAHLVTVLLCVFGVIASGDSGNVEKALSVGLTAVAGVVSSAAVVWKYIHHSGSNKP